MKTLVKVSLRENAIYIPKMWTQNPQKNISDSASNLLLAANKMGFTFEESLLHALSNAAPKYIFEVGQALQEVTGMKKNWTPLVKGWNKPTNESRTDHLVTFFHNINHNLKGSKSGTVLQCGHLIPDNTFPLERYNGCPFCGTPFQFGAIEKLGQGSKLKVLILWTEDDLNHFYSSILKSKTALDATQVASLKTLLDYFPIPAVKIEMKETLMLVIKTLVILGKFEEAQNLFHSPQDILRYLWYQHTGNLQLVKPKTIIAKQGANNRHLFTPLNKSNSAKRKATKALKLKYKRAECLMVATWLNNLNLEVEKAAEIMHPQRGMWVRFIRALRLAEYSKRKGFDYLARLMDVFYHKKYTVWAGEVQKNRLACNKAETFEKLKERPSLFARSLFSNMLWFGEEETANEFMAVVDKVPARLVISLSMYADSYFDGNPRTVKPLGGVNKIIPGNQLLSVLSAEGREKIKKWVEKICHESIYKRFEKVETNNKTIFIEPLLYKIPLAIGDRSDTIQDLPSALMGTRFPIEGNKVRLFMQWGKGLPAQHLDMDLSCRIVYKETTDYCSYSKLNPYGCKHSGDIRSIPNNVGTAEYIEINIEKLASKKAQYVVFTCNAYSNGSISPNLVVGWMNSQHKIHISKKSGVAYDPSCVQHQVRVSQSSAKGLIFGVLDVDKREIIWLEMMFQGQVTQNLDLKGVEALIRKLDSKISIGKLLETKALAQELEIIEDPEADEKYDLEWAKNTAQVTQLFLD